MYLQSRGPTDLAGHFVSVRNCIIKYCDLNPSSTLKLLANKVKHGKDDIFRVCIYALALHV